MENNNNDINLINILILIKERFFLIFFISLLASALSYVFSNNLREVYRSEAVLVIAQNPLINNKIENQFSNNIASFIGGGSSSSNNPRNINAVIAKIKSFDFFKILAQQDENLINNILFAYKWDKQKNIILYDIKTNSIENLRDQDVLFLLYKAYLTFHKKNFEIIIDQDSGIIRLRVDTLSPYYSKEISELILSSFNSVYKEKEYDVANQAYLFLIDKMNETSISEVRKSLSALTIKQLEVMMLNRSTDEYIFETIDSPVVSEFRISPNKKLIVAVTFFISYLLTSLYIIFNNREKL